MSATNNGGAAFPNQIGVTTCDSGMTLRDYFAGQALVGILSSKNGGWFGEAKDQVFQTRAAYAYADSMLAARDGGAA